MSIKKTSLLTTFLLVVSAFVMSSVVFPQERDLPKFSAKVKLSVTADDKLKATVTSYLTRELRSISDVIVVYENAEWELCILAMELHSKGGFTTGVAISVVILRPLDIDLLKWLLTSVGDLNSKQVKVIDSAKTWNLYNYRHHWIAVDPLERLKSLCQEIIADFDSEFLEEERKRHQEILKYIPPE